MCAANFTSSNQNIALCNTKSPSPADLDALSSYEPVSLEPGGRLYLGSVSQRLSSPNDSRAYLVENSPVITLPFLETKDKVSLEMDFGSASRHMQFHVRFDPTIKIRLADRG